MEEKDIAYLKTEGYSDGLIQTMLDLKKDCAQQIWLIDNSESMTQKDGHVLSETGKGFVDCTRWEELSIVVRSHIRLSAALRIPSSFRLLNSPVDNNNLPATFGICESDQTDDVEVQVQKGLDILKQAKPHGKTPLTEQFLHIAEEIHDRKEELAQSGKSVAIILCTDGVATDTTPEIFVEKLKLLQDLPVHLAIRLCTDEPRMVEFYNQVDQSIQSLNVDVLVDFQAEAAEICKVNPWLNYAMPIHRAREMGGLNDSHVLDNLDEAALTKQEIMEFCRLLFGKENMVRCPNAEFDWDGFLAHIKILQEEESQLHWDPIEEEMKPWVDFGLIEDPKDKLSKMRKIKQKKKLRWFTGGILGN